MLSNWLTNQTVKIVDSVDDWKSAVQLSAEPLLESCAISKEYIEAIYRSHEKNGPYYVLAPGIAMPHARPEDGVNQVGLTMLLVKKGVNFNSKHNDPVYLIATLAASDGNSHLDMLTQLAGLFSESTDMDKILKAEHVEQILAIISKY